MSGTPPLPLIISSPSGAGKTTLTRRLLARLDNVRFSVSHTTRKPRDGEQSGREYHFVDRQAFEALSKNGEFLEWAVVHGNLYGTHRDELRASQGARGVIFDIDHQGARQIKSRAPEAVAVFVLPPSMRILEERLRGRASEDEETLKERFATAREEIEHYGLFDYVIVNDDLDTATTQLVSIFLAEECKRTRAAGLAEELLAADRD
jgi:guanylate kinase